MSDWQVSLSQQAAANASRGGKFLTLQRRKLNLLAGDPSRPRNDLISRRMRRCQWWRNLGSEGYARGNVRTRRRFADDTRAFVRRLKTVTPQRGHMQQHIRHAIVRNDEAIAFGSVEPFYPARNFDQTKILPRGVDLIFNLAAYARMRRH